MAVRWALRLRWWVRCALVGVLVQQHSLQAQRQGLELRREALLGAAHRSQNVESVAGLNAQTAEKTVRELGTPWSQLLVDLKMPAAIPPAMSLCWRSSPTMPSTACA